MFSSVEPASFRTKCHTAGEDSRGRPQATTAECWFLPSERTRRHAERKISNKYKNRCVLNKLWNILFPLYILLIFTRWAKAWLQNWCQQIEKTGQVKGNTRVRGQLGRSGTRKTGDRKKNAGYSISPPPRTPEKSILSRSKDAPGEPFGSKMRSIFW